MNITFRKVSSPESFKKLAAFLTQDVIANGGSASETVDMHGQLQLVIVCKVPWGILVINREVDKLEAMAWLLQDN